MLYWVLLLFKYVRTGKYHTSSDNYEKGYDRLHRTNSDSTSNPTFQLITKRLLIMTAPHYQCSNFTIIVRLHDQGASSLYSRWHILTYSLYSAHYMDLLTIPHGKDVIMERFLFIVQQANKEIALAVCKYLKPCFELRKQKMSHQT